MSAAEEPVTVEAWQAARARFEAAGEAYDAADQEMREAVQALRAIECRVIYLAPTWQGRTSCLKRRGHTDPHGPAEDPA